jgi:MFS family permease
VARLAFVVNIGDAALWTILPIHLVELAGGDGPVGYYFALIALIGALVAVFSAEAFRRYRKIVLGAAALVAMVALLAAMSLVGDLWQFARFDIPRSALFVLTTIILGLLVHDTARHSALAMAEGRYYQFSNFGWLIGPVVAGYVARFFGNEAVFIFISGVFALALGYLWHLHLSAHPGMAHTEDAEGSRHVYPPLREFLRLASLRRVFVLALGLEFWWIVSAIYIPIAIIGLGFGPDVVGWVVTGGIVPLVLIEPWVGRMALQRGTRPYLVAGFGVLALGAASFVFLGFSPAFLLFMFAAVNIGAALIEPLKDTHFFEVVDDEQADEFFGVYNAAAPVASLFGPLLGALVLTVGLGLDGVWIMTGLLLALCARAALRISPGL